MTRFSRFGTRPWFSAPRRVGAERAVPRLLALEDRTLLSTGALDPGFGTGGKATVSFDLGGGLDDEARAIALQPDGKVVLAGSAQLSAGNYDFAVARLNANGTIDASFNGVGKRTIAFDLMAGGKDRAYGVALQPDGKIVIVGSAQVSANAYDFAVVRLNPDSTLDTTFNGTGRQVVAFNLGGTNADEASGVAVQADGKIVVVGYAGTSAQNKSFAVARLSANGTLDATFNGNGKLAFHVGSQADEVRAVVLQPDGKIVLAGYSQVSGANNDFAVARVNPNGSLDAGFNLNGKRTIAFDLGGGKNDGARSVALQADGRIVVAGYAERFIPNYDFGVTRLNADGSLDTTFNGTGKQTVAFDLSSNLDDEPNGVLVQPNGRILVAGFAQTGAVNFDFAFARLTPGGALDPSYAAGGKQTIPFDLGGPNQDEAFGIAWQPDGRVVAGGIAQRSIENFDFAALRVDTNQVHFFAAGGAPGRVNVFRPDGTLVTGFAPYGSAYQGGVAVALADVNGDGIDDLVTGAQSGNPHVQVFGGAALAQGTFDPNNPGADVLASFFPYALNFNVGSNVAAGDVNGDGYADIITGASAGNPHTKIFSGKDVALHAFNPDGASKLAEWFPYALQFNVGANVATGDVTGTGFADVITAATVGNPDVRVYRGRDLAAGTFDPNGTSRVAQFFGYGLNFNVGAFVTAGDVNGDGFADVVTGSSAGNPQVKVFSGKAIAEGTFNGSNPDASQLASFYAFDTGKNLGVSVGAADFDGDGLADLLTGSVHGSSADYRVVKGMSAGNKPTVLNGLEGTITGIQDGIFVAA
jgi:uncharacterized delta-60 repeat protein